MNDKRFKMISKPYSPKNVIIKRDRGTYLFLDPDTPNWVVVNAIGRDILEFCDGKHTIKEISPSQAGSIFGAPKSFGDKLN